MSRQHWFGFGVVGVLVAAAGAAGGVGLLVASGALMALVGFMAAWR